MIETQLYNQTKQKVYPVSHAQYIISEASGTTSKVEDNLKSLWTELSKISGNISAVDNIIVNTYYASSNSKDEVEVSYQTNWSDKFSLPTDGSIYVWQKTEYTYKGSVNEANTTYSIVYADVAEVTQTIYRTCTDTEVPKIDYPILTNGYGEPILDNDGNEQLNLKAFDRALPIGWEEYPQPISPSRPNAFMSIRKKVNGVWEKFSDPAQYGKWPVNSVLETRYTVSNDIPQFSPKQDSPGETWTTLPPTDFSGKLWMVTASSVAGVLNEDADGVIWKGPILIGVV